MLPEMTHGGTEAQCHRRHFMGSQGHAKGQAKEQQCRQLDQPRAATGKCREQIGEEGNDKKQGLFQRGGGSGIIGCNDYKSAGRTPRSTAV